MKIRILKSTNWIYGLIISMLGFMQGCIGAMYGCPTADHTISGRVTDMDDNPLGYIEVELSYDEQIIANTYTDEKGEYSLNYNMRSSNIEYQLLYKDVDGAENGGEFDDMIQSAKFKSEDFKGGDGDWYYGKAIRVVDIVMQKKKQ